MACKPFLVFLAYCQTQNPHVLVVMAQNDEDAQRNVEKAKASGTAICGEPVYAREMSEGDICIGGQLVSSRREEDKLAIEAALTGMTSQPVHHSHASAAGAYRPAPADSNQGHPYS